MDWIGLDWIGLDWISYDPADGFDGDGSLRTAPFYRFWLTQLGANDGANRLGSDVALFVVVVVVVVVVDVVVV